MLVTCDYLILGAGAQGLAFTDALVSRMRGAKVAIVDRRSSPGGMWNDTYAFATLDEPGIGFESSTSVRLDITRPKGGGELSRHATKSEVLRYFMEFMTHLVRDKSVQYFPSYSAEVVRVGRPETQVRLTSTLVADKTIDVTVRKKVVYAGCGSVPAPLSSHPCLFESDPAVKVVRPHELPFFEAAHWSMHVVIGAGKTGLDTVLWLLSGQVPAEKVRWVVPRDSWYLVAEEMEHERFHDTCIVTARCAATAESTEDLYLKMEEAGKFHRIDEQRFPEVFHCIHMSRADLASLRAVPALRLGHVRRVASGRLHLERGSRAIPEGALCVDCTGAAGNRVQGVAPIFSVSAIKLQQVAEFSWGSGETGAPLCAGAIGLLEAMHPEDAPAKNSCCTPAPFPDHYNDWVKYLQIVMRRKKSTMSRDPRLNTFLLSHPSSHFSTMSAEKLRQVMLNLSHFPAVLANLDRITPADGFSRLQGTSQNHKLKQVVCDSRRGDAAGVEAWMISADEERPAH